MYFVNKYAIISRKGVRLVMESVFYDGTKLLSLLDLEGNKPEIYMCTTNRTGGKTTYFNRLLVNRWKNKKEKFCLIYRFNYELDDIADKFFKDIQGLFFPNSFMEAKKMAKGIYCELYIDEELCGYAVALNNADTLKRYSHLFSDVSTMLFDEFQSETNHYCADEITKFRSIHTSFARGQGKQYRYLPVIMISNPVSIINPYYVKMGISARLKKETKFLRGKGFVLEQGYNETASLAQQEGGFNKAFGDDEYNAYSQQGVYLNDNLAFIEKPKGRSRYLATIKYDGTEFGIREFADEGVIYCDNKPDTTYPFKISITTEDHNINYVMLKRNDLLFENFRYYFNKGCFRFQDLRAKEALMTAISY